MIMLIVSMAGFGLLYYRKPLRTMVVAKRLEEPSELKPTSKVVNLTPETEIATADQK